MDLLNTTGLAILKWLQGGGIVCAAIALCIGGYYFMLGGDSGRPKAKGWFIGATVGLIVVMGAYALAQGINSNIRF
ncbi:hypothetical protein HPK19_24925 (plasmid) [Arthrobacter citreus]|nr:hypothetical protein HPK19_24925 [Arthrobacter citreus]